jgi:hypothetical protein
MTISFKIIGSSVHVANQHMWASVQFADLLGGHGIQVPFPVTESAVLSAVRACYERCKQQAADEAAVKDILAEYVDKIVQIEL